jgi:hypothetical protein
VGRDHIVETERQPEKLSPGGGGWSRLEAIEHAESEDVALDRAVNLTEGVSVSPCEAAAPPLSGEILPEWLILYTIGMGSLDAWVLV